MTWYSESKRHKEAAEVRRSKLKKGDKVKLKSGFLKRDAQKVPIHRRNTPQELAWQRLVHGLVGKTGIIASIPTGKTKNSGFVCLNFKGIRMIVELNEVVKIKERKRKITK